MFGTAAAAALVVILGLNFVTPEKSLDQTIPHRHPVDSLQFRRELGVLLGPSLLGGNRVEALQNGVEIFPSMLEAIRSARRTITFETYIYWSGEVGREFADALSERARSGVEVNVLVDWVGSLKMDPELIERMRDAGVRVERFRPLRWYHLGKLNYRTHRKLLVVDGRVGFTGGVGIADQWQGNAEDEDHWRDMHFRVEGPVVSQFQAAFNDNWIKTTGEVLAGDGYFPPQPEAGDLHAHVFVASPSGGSESMHLMYLMSIAAAERTIDLQAAYFIPDRLMRRALVEALERGVRVRIMVPGKKIDAGVVRLASRADWGELLAAGAQIYEYQPTMMHNKLLVIDGYMVSVGSTNFDERSFRLNEEASMNVYDREFAQEMLRVFEADLEHTEAYDFQRWRERPWREKFVEKVVIPIRSQL
ncbi:phospholipase D-like domain-containing protein [Lysobacter sp. CAU 1642]|uniref:Phospholipase D-like domain-containing protein n=1 Tax=Pseudomarimonas salicorniae TaxID=2933270 RepID=A0ABT0GHW0_9GAMM|nr:phospholipase D-like domain-containing protein [Lysobacter sp. CAU 1642]MCK7593622.1 phospholipase D-like domain-containing protein [Lysobacter sp. CAU 1642]